MRHNTWATKTSIQRHKLLITVAVNSIGTFKKIQQNLETGDCQNISMLVSLPILALEYIKILNCSIFFNSQFRADVINSRVAIFVGQNSGITIKLCSSRPTHYACTWHSRPTQCVELVETLYQILDNSPEETR